MTAQQIIKAVCDKYHLDYDEVVQTHRRSRAGDLTLARYMAMHIIRMAKAYKTLDQLGKLFRLDHSTVIHSAKAHESYMLSNQQYRADYRELWQIVNSIDDLNYTNIYTKEVDHA
jgi:chromosomal replication initiation ATPase DnaA